MTIEVDLANNDYKVIIGKLKKISFNKKVAIVTNPTIAGYHLKYLLKYLDAKELKIITVNDGERYKNLSSIENILNNLFDAYYDRNSLIVAFGGGVIGDMSGFSASIFQRGIDFIQIPTTLLSQVDASVGGKTGINNSYGKNLIGSFYQPKAVYIDTYFLSTLPQREFNAGVAEIIKMAVIFDSDFFEFLKHNTLNDMKNLEYAIKKSVELKAKVVISDEKEKGERAKLNYGHTFCHVIENETNYSQFLHGEAVSIGIVMANYLALKLDMISQDEFKQIRDLLQKYNLPLEYKILDLDKFYSKFFLDKKSQDNTIKFILPFGIGSAKIVKDIKKNIVIEAISEFI